MAALGRFLPFATDCNRPKADGGRSDQQMSSYAWMVVGTDQRAAAP